MRLFRDCWSFLTWAAGRCDSRPFEKRNDNSNFQSCAATTPIDDAPPLLNELSSENSVRAKLSSSHKSITRNLAAKRDREQDCTSVLEQMSSRPEKSGTALGVWLYLFQGRYIEESCSYEIGSCTGVKDR